MLHFWKCGVFVPSSARGYGCADVPQTEHAPFAVTVFPDTSGETAREFQWRVDELAERLRQAQRYPDKDSCPLLKLARFGVTRTGKNSLRHDGNVIEISGIEADYDGEKLSFSDAQALIARAGVSAVLYTSASHTEDAPRWRVLCPTSRPYPPSARARFVARLNGILGGVLAPESFRLSQSYFIGRVSDDYAVARAHGRFIDLADDLDTKATYGPKNGESRADRLAKLRETDPAIPLLEGRKLLLRVRPDGAMDIICPFESEHTTPRVPGDCTYFPAHTGGFKAAHFKCLHSHCASRTDDEFLSAIGVLKVLKVPGSAHSDEWGRPEPLPELPPVPSLKFAHLPAVLRAHVQDIAERMQCPPDFSAVACLAMAGSAIGRKVGIRPKRADDWTVIPNLWAMIVGKSGIMKSPAIGDALAPLRRMQEQAFEAHEQAMEEYGVSAKVEKLAMDEAEKRARDLMKKGNKDAASLEFANAQASASDEPTARRYIVNDSTVEALAETLEENPNGVLLDRDELAGWLRSLDKDGQQEARAFYLTAADGDKGFTTDRIGRGRGRHIEAVCVSIVGGIQPGVLAGYVRETQRGGAGDDGLLQRFGMMVYPDVSPTWRNIDRRPAQEARRAVDQLIAGLCALTTQSIGAQLDDCKPIPFLRFDNQAQGFFDEWRGELERRIRATDEHPAVVSHLAKYRKLVPALALINHLCDRGVGAVTEAALSRAVGFADYLEPHARRVYDVPSVLRLPRQGH